MEVLKCRLKLGYLFQQLHSAFTGDGSVIAATSEPVNILAFSLKLKYIFLQQLAANRREWIKTFSRLITVYLRHLYISDSYIFVLWGLQ